MRITLLQKRFVVSAVKSFFISVSSADTILRIQKLYYFSYRLFPADTQNRFSKIKKNRSPDLDTLAPDRALLVDARRGRRCYRISSCLRRAVGESRLSRSWSSGASSTTGIVGAPRLPRAVGPHRLDRRILLAAAEHHLRLASDWSRRCRRLRPPSTTAVVSVPWHAAPYAVDEDGDEWWERERGRRPKQGGAYLNMMMSSMKVTQRAAPDLAHRWSLLGGGAGSRAPLAVVVEEGSPCARRRPTPPRRRRGSRRPRAPRWPPRGPARERRRESERG
jgi:hypothetical protein